MKSNHKRELGGGIFLFVLAILWAALCIALYIGYKYFDLANYIYNAIQQLFAKLDPSATVPITLEAIGLSISDYIVFVVVELLLLIPAFINMHNGSLRGIAKAHDVFGQPKMPKYFNKLFFLPMILGVIFWYVSLSFNLSSAESIPASPSILPEWIEMGTITGLIGTLLFYWGLVLSYPKSYNQIVSRRFKGRTLIIVTPKRLLKGKFAPYLIANELSWAACLGYTKIVKFEDFRNGRVRITLEAPSDYSKADLKEFKKQYLKDAIAALKSGNPMPGIAWEVEEWESDEHSRTRGLYTSVNDYDTVTTYSDGTKTRDHHYTNVRTGTETTYYRNVYDIYSFYYYENGNHYLQDDYGEMVDVYIYRGSNTTGRTRTGSGY